MSHQIKTQLTFKGFFFLNVLNAVKTFVTFSFSWTKYSSCRRNRFSIINIPSDLTLSQFHRVFVSSLSSRVQFLTSSLYYYYFSFGANSRWGFFQQFEFDAKNVPTAGDEHLTRHRWGTEMSTNSLLNCVYVQVSDTMLWFFKQLSVTPSVSLLPVFVSYYHGSNK